MTTNQTARAEVLRNARNLIGHSVDLSGNVGESIEALFGLTTNNSNMPDFTEAGIELKTRAEWSHSPQTLTTTGNSMNPLPVLAAKLDSLMEVYYNQAGIIVKVEFFTGLDITALETAVSTGKIYAEVRGASKGIAYRINTINVLRKIYREIEAL